jgi:GxxExxY protein
VTFTPAGGLSQLTHRIVGAAINVHRALGPGLLESAYQACLEYELLQAGLEFRRQVALPVHYCGVRVECGYRVDLIIAEQVIVEVKAVETLTRVHQAQMITYLKLTGCPVGLLLNFNVTSLRHGIRRLENRPTTTREASSNAQGESVEDRHASPADAADRRSAALILSTSRLVEEAPP